MDSILSIIKGVTLYIINLLLLGSRKIWSLMWPAALTSTIMMGYHSCEPYPDLFGRMIPYKSVKNIVYKIPECTRQGVFWETASRNFFLANVTILYPLKTLKNLCFLVFVGGRKWEHWPETGEIVRKSARNSFLGFIFSWSIWQWPVKLLKLVEPPQSFEVKYSRFFFKVKIFFPIFHLVHSWMLWPVWSK